MADANNAPPNEPLSDAQLLALSENLIAPYQRLQPVLDAYTASLLGHTAEDDQAIDPSAEELDAMDIFDDNGVRNIPEADEIIHHDAYNNQLMFDDLDQLFSDDRVTAHRIACAQTYFATSEERKFTFDWAQHKLEFSPPPVPGGPPLEDEDYSFVIDHHLDFLHIYGRANRVVTVRNAEMTGFQLRCFRNWKWKFPISNSRQIRFDISGLTFQLAQNDLIAWWIIMEPVENDVEREKPESAESTCLSYLRGTKLSTFILSLFRINTLSNVGVSATTYLADEIRTLTNPQFYELQRLIMLNWYRVREQNVGDIFWAQYVPTFHAISIGQNIELPGISAI